MLFCLFQWVVVPVFDKQKKLGRILVQKQAALAEMEIFRQKYVERFGRKASGKPIPGSGQREFSLFSFMDTQARQSGIKENVVYIRPFTRKHGGLGQSMNRTMNMVDIQLASVNLSDLMRFLSLVESEGQGVVIQSLSLTRKGGKKSQALLDVLMETAVPAGDNG